MTNEEAKIQIQATLKKIWDQFSELDIETMEMVFSALEKQIPKKVVQNKGLINPVWVENAHLCPVCFSWAGSFGYCSKCGQAIDWEEGE